MRPCSFESVTHLALAVPLDVVNELGIFLGFGAIGRGAKSEGVEC